MMAQPCMDGSKKLRLFSILILYVAQGIPIGLLLIAIPAWMAANGATSGEIGFVVGMATLPWSFKFINGLLMDRYAYLPMGRRRAWLIGAQAAMVIALIVCAFLGPNPRDWFLLGIVAVIVNSAVVFQDVAADALAVDLVKGDERGLTGGLMSGGQALGISISSSSASFLLFHVGAELAFLSCAATMAFVTGYLIWIRERHGERRLPWTAGKIHLASRQYQAQAWRPLLKHAFGLLVRPNSLIFVVVLFIIGLIYGTMTVAVPIIATNSAGWNEAQLGAANGIAQLTAALVAISLGGLLTIKVGAQRFQAVTLMVFAAGVFAYLAMQELWSSSITMMILVVGWTVMFYLLRTPMNAITLLFCDPKTGASQFSIYMAFGNLGISSVGFTFAIAEGAGGIAAVFAVLGGAVIIGGLLVIWINLPVDSVSERSIDSAQLLETDRA